MCEKMKSCMYFDACYNHASSVRQKVSVKNLFISFKGFQPIPSTGENGPQC